MAKTLRSFGHSECNRVKQSFLFFVSLVDVFLNFRGSVIHFTFRIVGVKCCMAAIKCLPLSILHCVQIIYFVFFGTSHSEVEVHLNSFKITKSAIVLFISRRSSLYSLTYKKCVFKFKKACKAF